MQKISNLYQRGIEYWNRSELKEAEYYFNRILKDIYLIDECKKTRMAEFYIYIKSYNEASFILKDMIEKYENITFSVINYLRIKEDNVSVDEINFILNIKLLKYNIEVNYLISKILHKKGNKLKSYQICTDTIDYIERNTQNLSEYYNFYFNLIILSVEIEYEFENYVQARYQLRKLINNPKYINESWQSNIVVYWSVVLDIVNEIIAYDEWILFIRKIDDRDLKIILQILIKLYKNELTTKQYKLLNNYSFEDERLKEKAQVILVHINKCIGNSTWEDEIECIDIKKHYLGMLIYFDKVQKNKNFKINEFFNKYFKYHSDRHQIINAYWNSRPRKIKKNLDNIKIKFIGGADKIGGSCIFIQHKNTNILLDAGANIHGEYYPDFSALDEENITLKDIDYLIISHSHFDHIGSLPYIYKQNNNIKIITTHQTKDIMKIMLEESERANIGEEKISSQDIKNVLSNVIVKPINDVIRINNDIKLTMFSAGHILGATTIYLNIDNVGLLYTGDYCTHDQYTVKGMSLPENLDVDILITESTYAYHPSNFNLSKENQEKLFINDITEVINNKGVVLIPAFAIGRAQELVMTIKEFFKKERFLPFNVYLDGKVVEICDVYEKYLNLNNKELYEPGISKVINRGKDGDEYLLEKYRGSCIIASSGMLNENSRSSKYANAIINDDKSLILFSGYLDEESPGKQLLKKINEEVMPTINIGGNTKEVLCNVKSYKMSAHIKKYELLKLMIKLKPKYTFLIHGDSNNKYKYMGDENIGAQVYPRLEALMCYINDTNIIVPKNGELYNLDKMEVRDE